MGKIINIWILWFQGINSDKLPWLNRECIKQWKNFNEDNLDFKFNFIDEQELSYLLPEIKELFCNSIHERTLQAKSDLIRLMLLDKYGGIWVDSSVCPMYPISHFISKLLNKEEFFAYRFLPPSIDKDGVRLVSSWFLISLNPGHYVITKWLKKLKEIYLGDYFWNYYQIHYTFSDLYYSDLIFAKIINNMVQKSEKNPHSILLNGFERRLDSYLYKKPMYVGSGEYEIKMLREIINNKL